MSSQLIGTKVLEKYAGSMRWRIRYASVHQRYNEVDEFVDAIRRSAAGSNRMRFSGVVSAGDDGAGNIPRRRERRTRTEEKHGRV